MSDPSKYTSTQEKEIANKLAERTGSKEDSRKGKGKASKEPIGVGTLYTQGITYLKSHGYTLELREGGDHCNFAILKPKAPPLVKGIDYPKSFLPLQEIYLNDDLNAIFDLFRPGHCSQELTDFWSPVHHPKAGDSDLKSHTERLLKMNSVQQRMNIQEPFSLGQSFDPAGRINGIVADNPRVWVPDKDWFAPQLHNVTMGDVFTIFPPAEVKILSLLLGRIGVGCPNHIPEGWKEKVDHTARMAVVVIGKDPGLGKSTVFNGMTAALSKCGFVTSSFDSTDDIFGMKSVALSNISYKDDTSLSTLRKFLNSEKTKIMTTNGLIRVQEKYMNPEQIMSRSVFIVNSNDWDSKFAYDLDPGIMDRIKLVSTYQEIEVEKRRLAMGGTLSCDSPDLRPKAHIPFLAKKLGVDPAALFLWCLRLSTDYFWSIIADGNNSDGNKLQTEVRYWTTRLRIKFKADLTRAILSSMAFSWLLRRGRRDMVSLNIVILDEALADFYFMGVDPAAQPLFAKLKERWDTASRPTTHYYQGFREVSWDSVKKASKHVGSFRTDNGSKTLSEPSFQDALKETMKLIDLRDGFKIGTGPEYLMSDWETIRYSVDNLLSEVDLIVSVMTEEELAQIRDVRQQTRDDWMDLHYYSPDNAEKLRSKAWEKLTAESGVKE